MGINFNSTRCCYCERRFDDRLRKTKEHIIPQSKGGNNSKHNIVYACHECNELRGNMDYKDFKEYIVNVLEKNRTIKIKSYSFIRSDLTKILDNINQSC